MILIALLCVSVSFLIIYVHYTRRRLYKLAAQIPGPTPYPIIGSLHLVHDLRDIRVTCEKMLEKFGSTFKVWLFYYLLVVVSNPKHLQIILNSPYCLDKDKRYNLVDDFLGNGLTTSPGHIWKRQRKLLNPTFSKKVVDSFVEIFVKHSEILVEQLEKEVGKKETFDANDYVSKCSLDFICETALGVSVDAQRKKSKLLEYTCRGGEILLLRAFRIWLHLDIIFRNSTLGREFYKIVDYIHNFTFPIINKQYEIARRNSNISVFDANKKKPFLEHVLSLGEVFTPLEIRCEVEVFMIAGSDTVSTTTQYALVALGMYKDVQEKVREELFEVFGNTNRQLVIDDLPKLTYLERTIKEIMRLYTPLPFIARSTTKEIDLGDFVIPSGCTILIPIAATHKNPEVWKDPLKFDPDRFLPEEIKKRNPYGFIPFSKGPRDCIGKAYAMDACKVMLATILRSYKIDTPLIPEKIRFKTEITSKFLGGANITIQKL